MRTGTGGVRSSDTYHGKTQSPCGLCLTYVEGQERQTGCTDSDRRSEVQRVERSRSGRLRNVGSEITGRLVERYYVTAVPIGVEAAAGSLQVRTIEQTREVSSYLDGRMSCRDPYRVSEQIRFGLIAFGLGDIALQERGAVYVQRQLPRSSVSTSTIRRLAVARTAGRGGSAAPPRIHPSSMPA
jgi:hypothetical protein